MNHALYLLTLVVLSFAASAQEIKQGTEKPICRLWYDENRESKIEIFPVGETFSGRVVWMAKPYDSKGKLRLDSNNPNESLRNKTIQNLVILHSFKQNPDNPNEYIDGKVYDPNNGKTYCGKITYKGKQLDLRGFICALPFLGRTTKWPIVE